MIAIDKMIQSALKTRREVCPQTGIEVVIRSRSHSSTEKKAEVSIPNALVEADWNLVQVICDALRASGFGNPSSGWGRGCYELVALENVGFYAAHNGATRL